VDVDTSSAKEQRNFGLVVAGLFVVLCAAGWWRRGEIHVWMLAVAGVSSALGLIAPRVLRPVLVVWLKVAGVMNWIVTHVLLTLCFGCMITPTRYFIRWFGEDPLQRQWAPDQSSYWEEPDAQPAELEAYKNQF
jgi:hypothetical protein